MSSKNNTNWFKSAFNDDLMDIDFCNIDLEPAKKKCKMNTSKDIEKSTIGSIKKKDLCTSSWMDNIIDLTSIETSPKKINTLEMDTTNWLENFVPTTIEELAVHSKKIEEVQLWFNMYESNKSNKPGAILLLTGPPGSCKTTALKVISSTLNYEILEWLTPVDTTEYNNNNEFSSNANNFTETQIEKFTQYLFKTSRYNSLFNINGKRLLLVEDFPNIFLKNNEGFFDTIKKYTTYGKSPLIFIVTDTKSKLLNISYNLFPENIKIQLNITQINFNPVSTTLMKRGIKRINSILATSTNSRNKFIEPSQEMIDSIILVSQGDLRNAINNLYFTSEKSTTASRRLKNVKKPSKALSKGKKKILYKLETIGKDETITLMHALGRVFNPKYDDNKLLHSPENITNLFSSQPNNFVSFIHANYINHMGNIVYAVNCSNILTFADVFMNEYRDDKIQKCGLNLAIRGVMIYNEKPIGGWIPVKGYKKQLTDKKDYTEEIKNIECPFLISKQLYSMDYSTFSRIILKDKKIVNDFIEEYDIE